MLADNIFNDDLPTSTGKRKRDSMDWAFHGDDLSSDNDLCGEDAFSSQDESSFSPKKQRGDDSDKSKYVRLCQLLEHEGDLSFEIILKAMKEEYPQQYGEWESMLLANASSARNQLIEDMCTCKDVGVKVLFNILKSWEFINIHPRGKQLWNDRASTFQRRFSNTIYRVLTDRTNKRSLKYMKRNPFLLESLQSAMVYVSHMLESMELNRNLCFLLCIASCIEGRGRYHGRSSKNLSILHKSYRYMIEELGGRHLSDIPEHERKPAEVELIATFEEKD